MGAVWREQAKFQSWLETKGRPKPTAEGASPEALDTIKAKASFEVERILEIEAEVRHVIAFTNVNEHVGTPGVTSMWA